MATAYLADNYSNPMPDCPFAGVQLIREFQYTMTAAFVVNDTVKLCPIPGNSNIVIDAWGLYLPDVDDATSFQCSIGDDDTADRFIAASTWGQAAAWKSTENGDGTAQIVPITYTANKNFIFKCTTAPGTGTFTGKKLTGYLKYHMVGSPTPVAAPA